VVKGVLLDKGFFDEKNFICFEDNCIEYVCKAKLTANVRKIIAYLDEQESWRELDDTYAVAELTVPLPSWERARRFVFKCCHFSVFFIGLLKFKCLNALS
jgi:hypothetical protein